MSDNIKLLYLEIFTILCFGSKVANTIFLTNSFDPVILLNKLLEEVNDNSSEEISKIIIVFKKTEEEKEDYYYYIIEEPFNKLSGGATNDEEFNKLFLDFCKELEHEKNVEIEKRIKEIKKLIKKKNYIQSDSEDINDKIIEYLFDIINPIYQ